MHPPYVNGCWERTGAIDAYQLLLQQDQQLRLLQAQVSPITSKTGALMCEGQEQNMSFQSSSDQTEQSW